MKIIQILPTLSYGDAVGNDTRSIGRLLKNMGYETQIYAENIDARLPRGTAHSITKLPRLKREDVILYHGSTGTPLNRLLPTLTGRKMMIYHNITPPEFFSPYSVQAAHRAQTGRQEIKRLAGDLEYCIADSLYNRRDLQEMGYTCPIDVCPILIPLEDYHQSPNQKLIEQYKKDTVHTFLFVGRIAPNKCQEDLLRAFCCYQKCYHTQSRLVLVGSWTGMERYYKRLRMYAEELEIAQDVLFTGHTDFHDVLAWYQIADVFLCTSEHEGFCVPLVEAMYFKLPIVAYSSTAIPDTLGGCGILLNSKQPDQIAWEMHRLMHYRELREQIITGQTQRLETFQYHAVSQQLGQYIQNFCVEK